MSVFPPEAASSLGSVGYSSSQIAPAWGREILAEQQMGVADPAPVPPTQGASQFALAITASEMLLSLGHSRVVMTQANPPLPPVPRPLTEWFLTLSMSPTAALMLAEQLKSAVAAYEAAYGKIPLDPTFSVQTAL
jgi:hypothetical protein